MQRNKMPAANKKITVKYCKFPFYMVECYDEREYICLDM